MLLGVVLTFAYVIFAQNFGFVKIVVRLPVDKVNFFQQLLLVEFQFSHHIVRMCCQQEMWTG